MAKAALTLVPTTLPAKAPPPNVSALAREFNVSRQTIRRWRAKGWKPPAQASIEIVQPVQRVATCGHPLAALLILLAISIAVLALVINAQTGWHFGTTPLAAVTFAAMATAGDLLAIVLPSAAARLWHSHHRVMAMAAWVVWSTAAGLAVLASLGFMERNVSDTAASRQAIVTAAASFAEQRTSAIEAARIAANAATKAKDAECMRRGPLCRDREADERTSFDKLNTAIAVPIPTAPAIGVEDPQVTASVRLAKWAGLAVGCNDITNLRLVLMVATANLAGLVLAFGLALRRRA